ncbi:two-component regulator propeller domain-containing protein [uncultured Bacteroides sp.]|uniref:two-component regulator propeller domain-containing protein n=1 Tax=uncultured Bacteroides sp. TaxID=162156 RepID=UPI002AA7DBA2|nr:two-component regulator propeller domain-containing protein [uncultured Bacteroides sp.]
MNFSKNIAINIIMLLTQMAAVASPKPLVINLDKDKYNAANKNWSIGQDERGVMYFGNDIGLLESDGMSWNLYRIPNSPIIRTIAVASHQTIFTGGFEELGRWDRDISGSLKYTSLKGLLKEHKFENENFWKVWIVKNKVYFQSFSNIYVYDYHTLKPIGSTKSYIFLLKVRDQYWVHETFGSLYRIINDKLYKIPGSELFSTTTVRVILPYGKSQYLVGNSAGDIYVYDGKTFSLWNKKLSLLLQGEELNCGLYSSKRNTYYLGTQLNGLYEVTASGEVVNHFSTTNSLQNNTILSLYEDNRDNIWVAMDRGLAYIRYKKGLSYYKATDRDAGAVYAATFWHENLFVGTNQGVYYAPINKLNDQNIFSSLQLIKGTQGQVWSFSEIEGRLFFAHNSGFKEIRRDLSVGVPYNINTGVFKAIEATIKGVKILLLATYNNLIIINTKTGKLLKMKQITDPIINVETDYLDNIWLETVSHGVYKCRLNDDLTAFRYYSYYGYPKDKTLPVKISLFKAGGRIIFLGDNKFWTYNENGDKLVMDTHLNECFKSISDLKRIVHIRNEESWAITGSAVYRFFYDGYVARILESYSVGADNLSLINAYENISVLNDTLSMICLDAGFILHTSAKKPHAPDNLPSPYLESVHINSIDGKTNYLDLKKETEVPYLYNNVAINFSVNNAFARNLYVEYQLEGKGVETTWSKPQRINSVSYARLLKGDYIFKVRVTDGLGHYSDTTLFRFSILPPWYQTIWAYLSYIVIIIATLYLTWIMILRRYRNIHLQKIRARESKHLRTMNEKLLHEIEEKNAELFTQTSFIIQKNELILRLKGMVDDYCGKNIHKSLVPLYQKMNSLLSNMDTEEDWKMFLIKFEQKNSGFFKHLKAAHPQLTNNDLRLCACLKLNLETKDIASLMNLSVRAIENNRYRLRKKLNLSPDQNLNEYFLEVE